MTAIEVLKTMAEICMNRPCYGCPLGDMCDNEFDLLGVNAEEIVRICEEWRLTHEISD